MLNEPLPASPTSPPRPRRPMAWLVALTLLAWMPGLLAGSFIRDDWFNFQRRPAHHLLEVLTGDWMQPQQHPGVFYRPVSQWSMQLDAMLFGIGPVAQTVHASSAERTAMPQPPLIKSPFDGRLLHWAMPFHFTNLALHAINGCLVFALLGMIPGMIRHRFFAASVFLVWPVHMGAVNWPSARTDILASTFVLLSLVMAMRALPRCHSPQAAPNLRYLILSLLATLLALGTKELAAVLPLLFVIAAMGAGVPRGWVIRGASLYGLLVLMYLGIRLWALGGGGGYPRYAPLQLSEFLANIDSLLSTLLMPWSEHARRGLLLWGAAMLAGLFIPRPHGLYYGLIWMALACLPMGGLIATIADGSRYLYLPAVGLAMCFAWLLERVTSAPVSSRSHRIASTSRVAQALLAVYLLLAAAAFAGHHASWLVAWRTADDTLDQFIAARQRLDADADALVPLNLTPRHRVAYIQDVWSVIQAINYLEGQPDPRLRHVPFLPGGDAPSDSAATSARVLIFDAAAPATARLPGDGLADLAQPRTVRSRLFRLVPLGQRDLFDISRANIEKGSILLADVPADPAEPVQLVFTNLDPPDQRLVLHGLQLHRLPRMWPPADSTAARWSVTPGRYLFAGIAGATIRLRPQDLAHTGATRSTTTPLVVQVDLNVQASRLTRLVMKITDGWDGIAGSSPSPDRLRLLPSVVHAFERVGPAGVPVPAVAFAMDRVATIELSLPAPGGWYRLEPSPVRIWATVEDSDSIIARSQGQD